MADKLRHKMHDDRAIIEALHAIEHIIEDYLDADALGIGDKSGLKEILVIIDAVLSRQDA